MLVALSVTYITTLQRVFFEAIHKGGGTERSTWGDDAYDRLESFSNASLPQLDAELSPGSLTDTLQWALALHFIAVLVLENIKLVISSRVERVWVVLDLLGSACFLASIMIKYLHTCWLSAGTGADPCGSDAGFFERISGFSELVRAQLLKPDAGDYFVSQEPEGLVYLLQGICAGTLLLRVLRFGVVLSGLGKFVLTYIR